MSTVRTVDEITWHALFFCNHAFSFSPLHKAVELDIDFTAALGNVRSKR